MHQEQDPNNTKPLEKLAEYAAGFLSNLAVAGMALAIFKAEEALYSILLALFALFLGALITYFYNRGEKE